MRIQLPRRFRIPVVIVLLVLAATAIYPIVYVAATSVRTNTDYLRSPYGIPHTFTFQSFVNLLESYNLAQTTANSLIVVVVATTASVTLAALAAFSIAKLKLPGRKAFRGVFISVMLVPSQVLIIPIFLMLSAVNLTNSLIGLIIVDTAVTIPYGVFLLTSTFRAVPEEVLEAAKLDGAGFRRLFGSIAVPMARTGVVTLTVLTFLSVWNELLFGYILMTDQSKQLLTPTVANIGGRFVTDQPTMMAGLLVTSLPPLILLAVMSKQLVQGMTAGTGK